MFWRLLCRVVSNLIKGMGADRMGGLAELDGFLQARPPQEMPVSSADPDAEGEMAVLGWGGWRPSARTGCMQLAMTDALHAVGRCSGASGLLDMWDRQVCSLGRQQR